MTASSSTIRTFTASPPDPASPARRDHGRTRRPARPPPRRAPGPRPAARPADPGPPRRRSRRARGAIPGPPRPSATRRSDPRRPAPSYGHQVFADDDGAPVVLLGGGLELRGVRARHQVGDRELPGARLARDAAELVGLRVVGGEGADLLL